MPISPAGDRRPRPGRRHSRPCRHPSGHRGIIDGSHDQPSYGPPPMPLFRQRAVDTGRTDLEHVRAVEAVRVIRIELFRDGPTHIGDGIEIHTIVTVHNDSDDAAATDHRDADVLEVEAEPRHNGRRAPRAGDGENRARRSSIAPVPVCSCAVSASLGDLGPSHDEFARLVGHGTDHSPSPTGVGAVVVGAARGGPGGRRIDASSAPAHDRPPRPLVDAVAREQDLIASLERPRPCPVADAHRRSGPITRRTARPCRHWSIGRRRRCVAIDPSAATGRGPDRGSELIAAEKAAQAPPPQLGGLDRSVGRAVRQHLGLRSRAPGPAA